MAQKPSIPKGTRDFSTTEMARRNYIFDTIRSVFKLYGFQQIETPAIENLSTLMGKYGEEGDKLLFKILNSGDFASKANSTDLIEKNSLKLTNQISEKGLKYDLTVPFARFVVQYQNDISFPFKRYQIQPVWRADRPQKGRYREFYQCDADIVGSNSLINEFELILIINDVFERLQIDTVIKINNRKILAGIAQSINHADKIIDITVAIDKLDKIGLDNVNKELIEKGISQEAVNKLQPILTLKGNTKQKLEDIEKVIGHTQIGSKGIDEVRKLFNYINSTELLAETELDLTLARGLNYYTGAIFEVKAKNIEIGSICGGGRYDDLTGIFGMPDLSGVGISFGADRIYDVINQLELFPNKALKTTKIMFSNFGEKEEAYCLPIIKELRKAGISAEMYPDNAKMKKQMTWANRKQITFVAIIGEEEIISGKISLKNMITGEQNLLTPQELIEYLKH